MPKFYRIVLILQRIASRVFVSSVVQFIARRPDALQIQAAQSGSSINGPYQGLQLPNASSPIRHSSPMHAVSAMPTGQAPPPAQVGEALLRAASTGPGGAQGQAGLAPARASSALEVICESAAGVAAPDVELRENSIGITLGVPRLSSVSRENSLASASLGGPLGAAWRFGDHSGINSAAARAVPSSLAEAGAVLAGAAGPGLNRESLGSLNVDGVGPVNISQLQAQFPAIFGVAAEDNARSNSSIDLLREDSTSIM